MRGRCGWSGRIRARAERTRRQWRRGTEGHGQSERLETFRQDIWSVCQGDFSMGILTSQAKTLA